MFHLKELFKKSKFSFKQISYLLKRPNHLDGKRFSYQRKYITHKFEPHERILDIGSGGSPFPFATTLGERYISVTKHRTDKFQTNGLPSVICDIHNLPFMNKQFDYVVCSHVLEHVDDPIRACGEIQRVGKAGFIETPRLMKDALFGWADSTLHKWHVEKISNKLVFFEYDQRLKEGLRSNSWYDLIFGPVFHPLQDVFVNNQDVFNVIFEWSEGFSVIQLLQDGNVISGGCEKSRPPYNG